MVFTSRRGEIPGGADRRRRGDAGSEWSSRRGGDKYLEARITGGAETRGVNGLHVAAGTNTWRRGSQEARRRPELIVLPVFLRVSAPPVIRASSNSPRLR